MDEMTTSFPIIGNRYQVVGTIATGGMAVVYLAKDLLLERDVALKILRSDYSQNQAFINSFKSEAKASAKLNHPNIITLFDFGQDGQRLYLVMEYIKGEDLKQIIKKKKVIDLQNALFYLIQACEGLGFAHQSGIVHCDVKPHNMLVSADGILKVTDFGIARALDSISADEKHDVIWGSPYYISPEQASGLPPSPYSDVYSLGIIAYEMLTGYPPFDGKDAESIANLHRSTKPKSLSASNESIPPGVNTVIMRALEKEPSKRYANGFVFSKALRELQIVPDLDLRIDNFTKKATIEANQNQKELDTTSYNDSHNRDLQKEQFDWVAIILGFLALILAGGLIPFWIYIYLTIASIRR